MSSVRRYPSPVPSSDHARAPRVLAVWVALVVCSTGAHGMAGGRTSPATLLVLSILAGAAAVGLAWRTRPLAVTGPSLAAAQLAWHLVSCSVPSTGPSLPAAGAGHQGHVAATAGGLAGAEPSAAMGAGAMTMPSPVWMTLAHLAAAVLVMGALGYGERALRWLLALGCGGGAGAGDCRRRAGPCRSGPRGGCSSRWSSSACSCRSSA